MFSHIVWVGGCVIQTLNEILLNIEFHYSTLHWNQYKLAFQWWGDLFRCRIDLLNLGFNIIAPYMFCVTHKWISPSLILYFIKCVERLINNLRKMPMAEIGRICLRLGEVQNMKIVIWKYFKWGICSYAFAWNIILCWIGFLWLAYERIPKEGSWNWGVSAHGSLGKNIKIVIHLLCCHIQTYIKPSLWSDRNVRCWLRKGVFPMGK